MWGLSLKYLVLIVFYSGINSCVKWMCIKYLFQKFMELKDNLKDSGRFVDTFLNSAIKQNYVYAFLYAYVYNKDVFVMIIMYNKEVVVS